MKVKKALRIAVVVAASLVLLTLLTLAGLAYLYFTVCGAGHHGIC